MESPCVASLLFTNLQLLGMDVLAMEGKHQIPFKKDMFNLPNKAGSEAVLHFLFNRLNPALFKEQFRDCWPVIDRKAEMQFRKVCNVWLTQIQADNPDAHLPRINASLLLSPGGRKYIDLLHKFSTYVLTQTMIKENGFNMRDAMVYPVLDQETSAFGSVMMSALDEDASQELQAAYFDQLHLTVAANRKWKENATNLVKNIRQLSRSVRDLENEKRQHVTTLAEHAQKQGFSLPAKKTLSMFDSGDDAFSSHRGQRIDKSKELWTELQKFSEEMGEKRTVVQSILDPDLDKPILNGTALGIRIPNLLLHEFQREIHELEIDNVYIGGRLNLESVTQLWNMCLKRYKKQLKKDPLPNLKKEIPDTNGQVHQHRTHLQEAQTIRDHVVNNLLPKLQRDVERLKKKFKSLSNESSQQGNKNSNSGLGLMAPTPPLSLSQRGAVSQGGVTPIGPTVSSHVHKDTPDMISSVMERVENLIQDKSKQIESAKGQYLSTGLQNMKKAYMTHNPKEAQPSCTAKNGTKSLKPKRKEQTGIHKAASKKPQNLSQKLDGAMDGDSVSAPTARKPSALDKLADMVVDSVLEHDSSDVDLFSAELDSLSKEMLNASMNELETDPSVFVSKDLLSRTPESKQANKKDTQQELNMYRSYTWEEQSSPTFSERTLGQRSDLFSPVVSSSRESNICDTLMMTKDEDQLGVDMISSSLLKKNHDEDFEPENGSKDEVYSDFDTSLSRNVNVKNQDGDFQWQNRNKDESDSRESGNVLEDVITSISKNVNENKEDSVFPNQARVPGDGQTSRESLVSSFNSFGSNEDDAQLSSLSKDSLVSKGSVQRENSETQQPDQYVPSNRQENHSLDDIFNTVSEVSENNFAIRQKNSGLQQPDNHASTSKQDNYSLDDIFNTMSGASENNFAVNDNLMEQLWSMKGINDRVSPELKIGDTSNISASDLLDLDSGDELVQGFNDAFSPLKGGIVLSGEHSQTQTNTLLKHAASPMNRNESHSRSFLNDSQIMQDVLNSPLKASGQTDRFHPSDNILTQMALLKQKLLQVNDASSEEDC